MLYYSSVIIWLSVLRAQASSHDQYENHLCNHHQTSLRKDENKRKLSYEFCSMATPNGSTCRIGLKYQDGKTDIIQVKELDNRKFRISDLSKTWWEYVSVAEDKPQISFVSNNLNNIDDCSSFLERYNMKENIDPVMEEIESFPCTTFAKALIRRILDRQLFPGNGNGHTSTNTFDEYYNDDDYGYEKGARGGEKEMLAIGGSNETLVDDDDGSNEVANIEGAEFCSAVTPNGNLCKLALELDGNTYLMQAEELDGREFSTTIIGEGQQAYNIFVKVFSNGTIVFEDGKGIPNILCSDFLGRDDILSSNTLITLLKSMVADETHECTIFGQHLLYFLALHVSSENNSEVPTDDSETNDDYDDDYQDNTRDSGSELCSMATPNGSTCKLSASINGTNAVFEMEELDNREFTASALVDEKQYIFREVKVFNNGTIVVDGSSPQVGFTCEYVLETFKNSSGLSLTQDVEFPCTEFAQNIIHYLIQDGLEFIGSISGNSGPSSPVTAPSGAIPEETRDKPSLLGTSNAKCRTCVIVGAIGGLLAAIALF